MDATVRQTAREYLSGLRKSFPDLKDPRVTGRCDHLLIDILAIVVLATMSGADDGSEIEEFGIRREEWLREFLELPNGIPSHDTFRRVFEALHQKQFCECLFRFTQTMHEATGGKLVAIDGKALRSSGRKNSGIPNLHLITAWASDHGLTLGQVACDDKSNEITAIPQLLRVLELKGCIVTIDAMGCQTEIARVIREQKAHCVLGLKGNQSGLLEEMQQLVEEAINRNFQGYTKTEVTDHDKRHGQEVRRTCIAIGIPDDHPQRSRWPDLRRFVVVITERIVNGQTDWETRSYITSHAPEARRLSEAIRKHWGIENSQHWVLDVAFGEDRRRQSARTGAANLAAVRRMVTSILRQETTNKRGIKNKRHACALDPSYLIKALQNSTF